MAEEEHWLGTPVSPLAPTSDRDDGGGPDGTSAVLSVADVGAAVSPGGCLPPQGAAAALPHHTICGGSQLYSASRACQRLTNPERRNEDGDGPGTVPSLRAQHPLPLPGRRAAHAPLMSCPLAAQEMRGRGVPAAAQSSSSLSPWRRVRSVGRWVKVGRVWTERKSCRVALPAEFTAVQE